MTVTKAEAYIEASYKKTKEIEKFNETDSSLNVGACGKLLRKIDSVNYPIQCTEETVQSVKNIQLNNDDLFLISFPQSGVKLLKDIILQLFGLKNEDKYRFPTVEYLGSSVINIYPSPRLLTTHLNYNLCPKVNNCKVILLIRNPKDVVASMFKHRLDNSTTNFENYYTAFINGETEFGDYFKHLKSFINLAEEKNILLLTYEQTAYDIVGTTMKLGKFLNLHEKISDAKNLFKIVEEVTLQNEININFSVKKWKEYFNEEQSLNIDKKFNFSFKDTPFEHIFDKEMKW
uniref:Sulfotransfer_1 domain-containing protein n=1 Tax=Parastrongyloides trichosuri TaxID=131310 RepID=A0A0N5A6K4_PARTI